MFLRGAGKTTEEAAKPGTDSFVFDVSSAEFEEKVLAASMQVPVIVDFWAPWCGPCKQLGPLLEKTVNAAGGKVLMAKINIDQNQDIAAALRIQSIPTVYAFFGGRPVDGFQGAVPESQLRVFVDKLVQIARQAQPDALDVPEALKAAAQALGEGQTDAAREIYAGILAQDPANAQAYAGLVRAALALNQMGEAASLVENVPETIAKDTNFAQARTALELAQAQPAGVPDELLPGLAKNPDDHQARFDLANAQFAAGQREEAVENLLEIVRRNRTWNEDQARKQLLKFFEALGPSDPLTLSGRRQLSSILFS